MNDRISAADRRADGRCHWAIYDVDGIKFTRVDPGHEINLTRLSGNNKAGWFELWKTIKATQPALAELLKDPELHALREHFNGDILINQADVLR